MGVIIGMDPHKRSATIEVIDERATVLAGGKYGTDTAGYGQMLAAARKFADRVWAVEGWPPANKRSWRTRSRRSSAAWPSPFTDSP